MAQSIKTSNPNMPHFAFTYDVEPLQHIQVNYGYVKNNENISLRYAVMNDDTHVHKNNNYNKNNNIIITPGGQRGIKEVLGFATYLANETNDLRIIVWDRRNMGQSGFSFNGTPLEIDEAEDLKSIIEQVCNGYASVYGVSSGARTNLILALKYPHLIRTMFLAPPTGGGRIAKTLAKMYYYQYIDDKAKLKYNSMKDIASLPYYQIYLKNMSNEKERQQFLNIPFQQYIETMQLSGDFLIQYSNDILLGCTDDELTQIHTPTMIFHHGSKTDFAHTIESARNACMKMPNCKLIIAPNREITFQHMIPFIIENGGSGDGDSKL